MAPSSLSDWPCGNSIKTIQNATLVQSLYVQPSPFIDEHHSLAAEDFTFVSAVSCTLQDDAGFFCMLLLLLLDVQRV